MSYSDYFKTGIERIGPRGDRYQQWSAHYDGEYLGTYSSGDEARKVLRARAAKDNKARNSQSGGIA
jgi:hypothetical protein